MTVTITEIVREKGNGHEMDSERRGAPGLINKSNKTTWIKASGGDKVTWSKYFILKMSQFEKLLQKWATDTLRRM